MSLPEGEIQCPICMEPPEKAVECLKCNNFFCENCVKREVFCPTCKAQPFRTQVNVAIRRIIERLRVPCEYCNKNFPQGEIQLHMKNCEIGAKKCSIRNCHFKTCKRQDAIEHLTNDHKDFIWDNFDCFPERGNSLKQKFVLNFAFLFVALM